MEDNGPLRIVWQEQKDGCARVLRLYGTSSQVRLPQQVEGRPIVEIAPYCFAAGRSSWSGGVTETAVRGAGEGVYLQELHTNAIEEVWLSDAVKKIADCAFYNCRKLHTLSIGAGVRDIGSDAFMNTLLFHTLILRCGAGEKSGVRQILAQVSADMEVHFVPDTGTKAALLYPEYYESYDEVAPAHLFGRSISGEGFRARQCIRDGRVDFAGYDAVFAQACKTEREETLSRMALNRLMYPFGLGRKSREVYREYAKEHIGEISARLVRQRECEGLRFLRRENLLSGAVLLDCVKAASAAGWAEGAAVLLGWVAGAQKEQKGRYDFGD